MSTKPNVFLPNNIMRTPVQIYGMESFEDAKEYYMSLDKYQKREFWYTISRIFDKRSENHRNDGNESMKFGYKASGIMHCLYDRSISYLRHNEWKEHVQFAMKVGDLRPDAFSKFLDTFYSDDLEKNERDLIYSLKSMVDKLWCEVESKVCDRFKNVKDWMHRDKNDYYIQEFTKELMKSILKGTVDYKAYHGQLSSILLTQVKRFEKLHASTAKEIEWLNKNIEDGYTIGIFSITRWQDLPWALSRLKMDGSVELNIRRHWLFYMDSFIKEINDYYAKGERFFHVGWVKHISDCYTEIINRLKQLSDVLMDFKEWLEKEKYTPTMKDAYKMGWIRKDIGTKDCHWYIHFYDENGEEVHQSDYFKKSIAEEMKKEKSGEKS